MKKLLIFSSLCVAFLAGTASVQAAETKVTAGEVASTLAAAKPGDKIIIRNGNYSDTDLRWFGKGTEQAPIQIVAETPGEVVFNGKSTLQFAGEWLHIEGLRFKDGNPTGKRAVIQFKLGDDVANNCRVTQCSVENYNTQDRSEQISYVWMHGRHNRFDHNALTHQLNLGVTLIVMLDEERSRENHHRIDHNFFGFRPVYGSNGAETLRVGTSHQADDSALTTIENNIFEECNGEVEVISIKSCDNIIRENIFLNCEGVLALRHGDRNIAEGNIFIGNGRRNTGGIRIVGADHIVKDNLFIGLRGYRFFCPLALMNAVPNSLPNRYMQVQNVKVTGNTFIDCSPIEFGTGRDLERTLPPANILFEKNVIYNPEAEAAFLEVDDVSGFTFAGNSTEIANDPGIKGFKNGKIKNLRKLPDNFSPWEGRGPQWLKTDMVETDLYATNIINVKAGENLPAIVDAADPGSEIVLTDAAGDYAIERALVADKSLTIRAQEGLSARPVIRFVGTKRDNMITIADGGNLKVAGIAFDGRVEDGKSGARAGITSADKMIKPYNLEVDNCEFYDFGESHFFAIKGMKNTFAESVVIRNCLFRGLAGDAINYAAERDDMGRYNADDMLIENCSFHRLLGLGINIYRGGSDESTAGPYVTIRNCNFDDVCNKERGSVMRLIGPQVLNITGCNFSGSGRSGCAIRLDEAIWEKVNISDCNLWISGRILSMTGNAVKGEIYEIEPQYVNPSNFDFRLKPGTELHRLGIGLK